MLRREKSRCRLGILLMKADGFAGAEVNRLIGKTGALVTAASGAAAWVCPPPGRGASSAGTVAPPWFASISSCWAGGKLGSGMFKRAPF